MILRAQKFLVLSAATLSAVALGSCGRPSYPKERLAESLVQLCRDEYRLDVQAQVAGTTLGVLVPIPGLIDELRRRASSGSMELPVILLEGSYSQEAFDFQIFARAPFVRAQKQAPAGEEGRPEEPTEPIKALQHVSTAVNRVSLSTDAPLEFYQIIARDPGPEHLDVIFSGHIGDSKQVQFYAISVGELQTRSEVSVRHQPEVVARMTVEGFLREISEQPLPQLLRRYTAPSRRYGDLLPKILLIAMGLEGRHERLIQQSETWRVLQVERSVVLVHVPLESVGDPGALLFTVQLQESAGAFLDIDRLEPGQLPPGREALGPPAGWPDTFYLEPISLPDFLTDQIAKRVLARFKPADPESAEDAQAQPATTEEVTRVLAETAAYVVKSYEFYDFDQIRVVDVLEGTQWVIPAADLPRYLRRNAPDIQPIR